MATTLTANVDCNINWSYVSTDDLSKPTEYNPKFRFKQVYTNGDGDDQINWVWADRRTVTVATANDDLDLAGVLVDVFGNTITAATLKVLFIANLATTSGEDLAIGAAGTNPITDLFEGSNTAQLTLGPAGKFLAENPHDGYAITAGSADTLRIAHAGAAGDISFDILLGGTS